MDNREAIHDELISPLVDRIIDICDEHGIPCVMSFEFAPDEHSSTVRNMDRAGQWMKFLMAQVHVQVEDHGTGT